MKFAWLGCFFLGSCALLQPCPVDGPALRFVEDYRELREDGLDQAEVRMLDRDAEAVERAANEKARAWQLPSTGNTLLDILLGLAGAAAAVGTSVKATNFVRDRRRKTRGEPT